MSQAKGFEKQAIEERRGFLNVAGAGLTAFLLGACAESTGPVETVGAAREKVLSSALGTITVVRVEDYATLQLAANAAVGKILYFSEGTHVVTSPVTLLANTRVLGAGRASVLQRASGVSSIFVVDGVAGVTIENLTFDVNGLGQTGAAAIVIHSTSSSAADISIGKNWFYTAPGQTARVYALVAASVVGLRFSENLVENLDVLASTGSSQTIFVHSNHIIHPPSEGLAVYAAASGTVDGCSIEDNLIEGAPFAGIHVGAQNESDVVAAFDHLVIRNNIVRGTYGYASSAILGYLANESRNWIIDGNILEEESTGNPASSSAGIRISGATTTASGTSLLVTGNTVRHIDLGGINIGGEISKLQVVGNRLEATRGLFVTATAGGMADVIVADNVVRGGSPGALVVNATAADIRRALISGNILMNATGFHCAGLVLKADDPHLIEALVRGNRCSDDQTTKTQSFGIYETTSGTAAGTFDTRYVENDVSGNATVYAIAPLGTTSVIRENKGYPTQTRGVASVSATSSPISHGLPFTPTLQDVTLTVLGPPPSWSSGSGHVWLVSVSSTSFVVGATLASGESVSVGWQASVRDV